MTRKCKKNILLIFGYLLVIAALFPPCETIDPLFARYGDKKYIFLPLYIKSAIKYEKFKKLESARPKIFNEKEEKEFEELQKKLKNYKILTLEEEKRNRILFDRWSEEQDKFKQKIDETLGYDFHYYKFITEFLIYEFAIILLAGGFAYIVFCVVLRKPEKKEEKQNF